MTVVLDTNVVLQDRATGHAFHVILEELRQARQSVPYDFCRWRGAEAVAGCGHANDPGTFGTAPRVARQS